MLLKIRDRTLGKAYHILSDWNSWKGNLWNQWHRPPERTIRNKLFFFFFFRMSQYSGHHDTRARRKKNWKQTCTEVSFTDRKNCIGQSQVQKTYRLYLMNCVFSHNQALWSPPNWSPVRFCFIIYTKNYWITMQL